MVKLDKFVAQASIPGMLVWLGTHEPSDTVGYTNDGGRCPLARFATYLGYGQVHVTRSGIRDDETDADEAIRDGGVALPSWMQTFVSGVDRLAYGGMRHEVAAFQAAAVLKRVAREEAIRQQYKEAEVVEALLREAAGAPFWITPLDHEMVEAVMARCRALQSAALGKDGRTKRGWEATQTTATWTQNMLHNFQRRLREMQHDAPGYRRLIAYEAAGLEQMFLLLSVADAKHLEFWLAGARLFTEIWLAASEPLLS